MKKGKLYTIPFRRKREKRTNYSKRLTLLLSNRPRLVVHLTQRRIIAQVVEFGSAGDRVIAATDSFALRKTGWNYSGKNLPAAYLTGLLLGRLARKKGSAEAVLDTGFRYPSRKGRIYAFLKGAVDAGLRVPYGAEDIFPSEERVGGQQVQDYAALSKGKKSSQFAQYLKNRVEPEKTRRRFEEVKQTILNK